MLKRMTQLPNIQIDIQEIDETHFVFHSGTTYYLWNCANDEGARVVKPADYAGLLAQIQSDFRKVEVVLLP
jgi:hypothetical protein